MSTEFHFEDIEEALETIREQSRKAAEWRAANSTQGDNSSQSSKSSSKSGKSNESPSDHSSNVWKILQLLLK